MSQLLSQPTSQLTYLVVVVKSHSVHYVCNSTVLKMLEMKKLTDYETREMNIDAVKMFFVI